MSSDPNGKYTDGANNIYIGYVNGEIGVQHYRTP